MVLALSEQVVQLTCLGDCACLHDGIGFFAVQNVDDVTELILGRGPINIAFGLCSAYPDIE